MYPMWHPNRVDLVHSAITDPSHLRATTAYLASLDADQVVAAPGASYNPNASYTFTVALVHMTSLVDKQGGDHCMAYQEVQDSDPTWHTDTQAHIDGGSMATPTNDVNLVWHRQPAVNPPVLRVADKRPHRPTHQGYLCVRTSKGPTLVSTYLTQSLPATILSPDATC